MISWALKTVVAVAVAITAAQYLGLFDGSLATNLRPLASTPAPFTVVESAGTREIHIAAHESGHYLVDATVNGVDLAFLVDTGASWLTLSKADAARAGIETAWLDYDIRMQTANGVVRAAHIELPEMRIGDLELRDVAAVVNDSPMGMSLLGMSFLERLDGYEVRDGVLILRW